MGGLIVIVILKRIHYFAYIWFSMNVNFDSLCIYYTFCYLIHFQYNVLNTCVFMSNRCVGGAVRLEVDP